ncbi:hypothetical protein [Nocardioides convexus]|uniref:hypothetical protein n=1 Tax=Nocardioides convexus TaxID=2712224 RepID=UPI0024187E70|nr:hypothetical protein [Nocardioides convexus]
MSRRTALGGVVGAGLVAAVLLLAVGGAIPVPVPGLPDPGRVTAWGLPFLRLVADGATIAAVAGLMVAPLTMARPSDELERAALRPMVAVRRLAATAAVAALVSVLLTYSDQFAVPPTDVRWREPARLRLHLRPGDVAARAGAPPGPRRRRGPVGAHPPRRARAARAGAALARAAAADRSRLLGGQPRHRDRRDRRARARRRLLDRRRRRALVAPGDRAPARAGAAPVRCARRVVPRPDRRLRAHQRLGPDRRPHRHHLLVRRRGARQDRRARRSRRPRGTAARGRARWRIHRSGAADGHRA